MRSKFKTLASECALLCLVQTDVRIFFIGIDFDLVTFFFDIFFQHIFLVRKTGKWSVFNLFFKILSKKIHI